MPALPQLDELLRGRTGDPLFLVFSLLVAAFLGAAHALTPGHGKTLVAAYLAGSRGRISDAIYLGSVVTATHTASVFLLGFTSLWAAQFLPLHTIIPVLSLISGVLVAGMGLWLFWQRLQGKEIYSEAEHNHAADRRGGLLSLGVSGGLVPCPEALVVLLLSVSLGRIAFGLALLTAFTLGLAAVLVAIGCLMVLAGPAVQHLGSDGWFVRRLPILSAAVVTVLGVAMIVEAAKAFA
jgi:nickel/cobalt transporter (NicO) family protein